MWLNLSSNDIGPAGVGALAKSPRVAALETLGLGLANTRVGAGGVRALAESPYLGRLRTLWLGHGLDDSAVKILVGDNRFARLAELHVSRLNEAQRGRLKARFGDRIRC